MVWGKISLLMTVGTGIGGTKEATDDLAYGILSSINKHKPDNIIFFGSKLSKITIKSVKEQFENQHKKELDFFEFIQIDEIDDFNAYFEAFKSKILELSDDNIIIDYTSGTKTMTMAAAFASWRYKKDLVVVSGKRNKGIVIKGTEKIITQNLYSIYDDLMIEKIKEMFNSNRFEAAKSLLNDVTQANKENYLKLCDAYYFFDNVDYKKANEFFNKKEFVKEWPELKKQISLNAMALHFLNEDDDELKSVYVLGSLLNNARRRAEETKYDDAIARLYRALELIAQIKLQKYGIDTSDVDLVKLKELNVDHDFEPNSKGIVKISLVQDYMLLNRLNDELGKYYIDNIDEFQAVISSRNNSILAHGLKSQTEKQYDKFRNLVFNFAKILDSDIGRFIKETKFPEFEI